MQDKHALDEYLRRRAPLTSVVSYPGRGPWGDNRYPGNCSGYLLIDLCATYRPHRVLDPMEGGGTSREVCADMGIDYTGFDLRHGVDSLHDEIGSGYDLIFWHPPYHDMKIYTDDARDLSRSGSVAAFLALLRAGYWRFVERLAPGGRLAILIGDMRRRGRYLPLTAETARLDRDRLEGIVVKIQHNVSSNKTQYGGAFVPILHETLTIYRQPEASDQ
ncbi:MAG TPA: hypothetical protein VFX76_17490 [Roseiflexaceae bacterium]|nr:hypothetical protein [Roseiflexaceae bacterium]